MKKKKYKFYGKEKVKTIFIVFTLIILLGIYISLQVVESNATMAKKANFNNDTKSMEFILGGDSVGIKLLATGVLVVEIDNQNIGLKIGDVILEVDNVKVESNEELIDYINTKEVIKKGKVILTVNRDNEVIELEAIPYYSDESGKYEFGLWVKDSSAGIGTVTFYEKNNKYFAALGHGITETSENVVLPIKNGAIVKSVVTSINKGHPKEPGDMRGTLYKDVYGQIKRNTVNGIYGILENEVLLKQKNTTIYAACKNEVKEGKAKIYCTLQDNIVKEYNIRIENVMYNSKGNKNMVIKIIDKDLLEQTGGIIQGMSGAPIVQDGKLVGAVTHVFLNDPTRGYGVFIQNMIEDMKEI